MLAQQFQDTSPIAKARRDDLLQYEGNSYIVTHSGKQATYLPFQCFLILTTTSAIFPLMIIMNTSRHLIIVYL